MNPENTQVVPQKQEPGNKIIKKIKFLNGKKIVKRTCGPGYKYDPVLKRCIKMSPSEIHAKLIGAKKRVRKMRAKMGIILRKRAKSMKIRKSRLGESE